MRRAVLLAGGAVSVAIGAVFACSFPSPDFADPALFKDGSFTGNESSTSTADGPSIISDSGNPFDGRCANECDCDDDGDKKSNPTCGGFDCDDEDPRINGDAGFRTDSPAKRNGDWNCNGPVELESEAGVICDSILDGSLLFTTAQVKAACAREGFQEHPGCSEAGTYNICEPNSLTEPHKCHVLGVAQIRTMGCR